ncbi:hypothetical protein DYB36_006493 [Aphanomyces astaci]|uniref:FYVE-type domain-containing protein n=3 Tax=Aphanomyces astaci TaxID=112090 RepID=A0A397BQL3_APHAT|nr:hypothetical protein DYB36_006493 [Aphanomyces astaci]
MKHSLGVSEKRTCYKYIQSRQLSALEFSSPDVVRDLVKSKNGVDVYESRLMWQDIRAVTRINGTVKDVMALLCADDTESFVACQKEILGDDFVGAKVLDSCLSDAKHDSSHYHCGLKWLAVAGDVDQGQPSTFDMVFLDYTDVCQTADKLWMGFLADTATWGVVEVTYAAHMDWKMPGKPKVDRLSDAVIQRLTNMRLFCESQRLKKIEIMDPLDWVQNAARSSCAICDLAFQFVLRTRHHCRMCGEVICRKCNTKVDVPTGFGMKQLRVRVCVHCLVRCRETQTELLQRPSAQPATRNRQREETFLCPDY